MKRTITMTTLALSLILAFSVANPASSQARVGVNITYQDFYDELSPHGRWMDYPDYGYVWIPNAGRDFRPYSSNGHWVWSDDYEWMWVSDYSWGWAPFHYGRWMYDSMYGWVWVPGYEWAPAWVAWRDGGDYYGWAPLRPGISIGISIGSYNPPMDYWCFTPRRYIASPRIYNHCLPARQNITIINNTTIINNYNRRTNNVFVSGPRRGDVERYTGRINPVRFREVNSPGRTRLRNNEVSVYRPSIQRDDNRNFAPRSVERYNRDRDNGNRNTDIVRRNGNNLPERRVDNGNTPNRNEAIDRQPGNDNRFRDRRENGNNLPERRVDNGNTPNRNEAIDRQPGNDNRFRDRRENDNNQPERRVDNPARERREVQQQPGNDPRSFERRERPSRPSEGNSGFERRSNQQPEREMRSAPRQRTDNRSMEQPQRREMRSAPSPQRQSSPQVERPQSQPRQFESRGNQGRSGGGNERGGGRGRRD